MFKPTSTENTNCMEGKVCPNCGQENSLWVLATIQLVMDDDGTCDGHADHEYGADAPTECPECHFKGPLSMFYGFYPKFSVFYHMGAPFFQAEWCGKSCNNWAGSFSGDCIDALKTMLTEQAGREICSVQDFKTAKAEGLPVNLNAFIETETFKTHVQAELTRELIKVIFPDVQFCPVCGGVHKFCRHCKKTRVKCGEADHDPFALCDSCDILLNGEYEDHER